MLRPKTNKKEDIKLSKDSWRKAKKIFSYLRPYSGQYFIGWVFLILSSSMGLIFPLLMGQLLGSGSDTPSSMQGILEKVSIDNVNSVALGLLILFVGQAIFSFIRVVTFTNVTEGALRDMRHDAFKRLIYMPMDFFNQNKVGELMSRISADITQVQEVLRTTIAEFFRQIIIIVNIIILKKSCGASSGFGPCVISIPCQTMNTIAPNKQKMINDTNTPRHNPLFTLSVLIISIAFSNLPSMNRSFVNALTFVIPISDSSRIEFEVAVSSCAFLDSLRINLPNRTAMMATTGTVANIINASFHDK